MEATGKEPHEFLYQRDTSDPLARSQHNRHVLVMFGLFRTLERIKSMLLKKK